MASCIDASNDFHGTLSITNSSFINNGEVIKGKLDAADILQQIWMAQSIVAMVCHFQCSLLLEDTLFDSNLGGSAIAGYFLDNSHVMINNCSFLNNSCLTSGCAVWLQGEISFGESTQSVEISSSTFHGNHAWTGYGGACLFRQLEQLSIQVCFQVRK